MVSNRHDSEGVDSGEDSQTEMHKETKTSPSRSLSKSFHPDHQTAKIFLEQGWRIILTCLLIGAVVITMRVFEGYDNFSHRYKILFNTILTALSIALGLNFFDGFKDMARVLRWRLLADRPFTIRETDLILGGDSVTKPLRLLYESPKKPIIFFGALFWISLNVAAQIGVAIISLTYSVDNGLNSNGTFATLDMVTAPKLDCFYNHDNCLQTSPETNMTIAHTYGSFTKSYTRCDNSSLPSVLAADQLCDYFGEPDDSSFAYRFWEYNPNDTTKTYPFLTNRTIRATADQCYEYSMGKAVEIDTTDGIQGGMLFPIHNETYNGSMLVPRPDAAFDATTYIYNGSLAPQNATIQSCGPRCINLYAYRSYGPSPPRPDALFSCHITISDTFNASLPEHHLPDDVARLAASSIALSGRYTGPLSNKDWHQYQLYAFGADWEIGNLNATQVGSRMAEFAIGTITGMAATNPKQEIPGHRPILGWQLNVQWKYTIPLLAIIAGAHMLLFVLIVWVSRPIVVIDDSYLSAARLLQGLVSRLDGGGHLLNGKELATAIQRDCDTHGGQVVYGVHSSAATGDQNALSLSEDTPMRRQLTSGRFPRGAYI